MAILKLHRIGETVEFQTLRGDKGIPENRRLLKLARRLLLITLILVWQPFLLEVLVEAVHAIEPIGKAQP